MRVWLSGLRSDGRAFRVSLTALCMVAVARTQTVASTPGPTLAIPRKPDPPPAVDGDLGEWAQVPNAIQIDRPAQVVFGRGKWASPADLRATVWLAWRGEHLYLAVDVTDDHFRQTNAGRDLWKGDCVQLCLDAVPDVEPERTTFGRGQFQIGLSPGNLEDTGDALIEVKPEAVVFRPVDLGAEGMLVAAKRTSAGYALEAAVPWSLVGVRASEAARLRLEVCISDCDADEAVQESMMTIQETAWGFSRPRFAPAVLGPASGEVPAAARGTAVFDAVKLEPHKQHDVRFEAPATPAGSEAVLHLKARLDTAKPAGYTPCMRLTLNDQAIDASYLLNKKPAEERVTGATQNMTAGTRFVVGYAPDFESPDRHAHYAFKNTKVCPFELRVTEAIREGANTLHIEHAITAGLTNPLILAEGRLTFRAPAEAAQKKGPPTGPLPVVVPAASHKIDYTLEQHDDGDLSITVGGDSLRVASVFSTPEPKWRKGSNRYFEHRREVTRQAETVIVKDTFTNRTGEKLPIMQRHTVAMPLKKVWLAGLSPSSRRGTTSDPANPTVYGTTEKLGLGLLALGDVFPTHAVKYSDGATIGLADNSLVLKPQAMYTAEWAIVPTATPDYYAFINAARRLRGSNFLIDGGFAFLRSDPRHVGKWSDEKVAAFIRNKGAKYICMSIDYPRYKGAYPHGTAFQTVDLTAWKNEVTRRRRLVPEVKHIGYFHCFIDVLEGADVKYADSRVLRSDGSHADYGRPHDKIFFPTQQNTFGRDIGGNVDAILDKAGCDGVYWDEIAYSRHRYHYGEPWDGISGDIDARTMKIKRLKSSVTLLSLPWRVAMAKRIMVRGPLIGNGAPHTQTMAALQFPRFIESGSISNLARGQLYSPISLGDHLTERSEVDAYRVMLRALDYGCVYHWYNDLTVVPTHRHLTHYMFPITPLELHQGYIIGTDRIITNRSGLFGWGDDSQHEVHVFDDEGREVPEFKAPTVVREGGTFTELRIGEGFGAAILRKSKG